MSSSQMRLCGISAASAMEIFGQSFSSTVSTPSAYTATLIDESPSSINVALYALGVDTVKENDLIVNDHVSNLFLLPKGDHISIHAIDEGTNQYFYSHHLYFYAFSTSYSPCSYCDHAEIIYIPIFNRISV